jgi:hypothetical protein
MSIAARLRLGLARSPWLYWAIVAVLAGTAGLLVMRAASGVDAARQSWGETRQVFVASQTIEAGGPLDGFASRRDVPSPVVPSDAVTDLDADAVARQRIAAGEIVVAHDIAPSAAPQSLIPAGWLAVAVSEPVASGAAVGDAVSVATGGIVVATDGLVVGVVGEALLVAVPADEAAQVAQAASTGDVAVLIHP